MTYMYRILRVTYHVCMNINLMTSASSSFKGDDKSEQDFKITTFMDNEMLFQWVYSEYHHYVQLNIVK